MHVRNLRFYQTMQFVLDLLAVSVAWSCTIQMRVLLNPLASQRVSWTYASIWAPSLMMVLVLWIVMAWRLGFYRVEGRIRLWSSIINAAEGALLASCIIVIVTFFSRELGTDVSRSFFMIFAPLSFFSLGSARCVSVVAAMVAERHWPSPIRAALLGDGSHAGRLVALMNTANVANVIKGLIVPEGHTADGLSLPMPILGSTAQLAEVINREHLNRIILLNGSISRGELDECNKVFKRMGVIVNCTVDFAPEPGRINVVNQYGLPLVELRPLSFTKGQEFVKRAFDIVASVLALLFLAPTMLVDRGVGEVHLGGSCSLQGAASRPGWPSLHVPEVSLHVHQHGSYPRGPRERKKRSHLQDETRSARHPDRAIHSPLQPG